MSDLRTLIATLQFFKPVIIYYLPTSGTFESDIVDKWFSFSITSSTYYELTKNNKNKQINLFLLFFLPAVYVNSFIYVIEYSVFHN